MVADYADICKEILEINKESYKQAVSAHQIALETFAKQIENTELTPKERVNFSNKMVEEAEKITELYLQQQKFHERILKNVGGTIAIVVLAGATILGLKAIGNDDLPQIDEEDDDAAKYLYLVDGAQELVLLSPCLWKLRVITIYSYF